MEYTLPYSLTIVHPFSLKGKWSLRIFLVLGCILVLTLYLFYIVQVNQLAREQFLVQDYEGRIGQLLEHNETLKINWSKSNSLNNIDDYLQNHNFGKVGQVRYIRILESSVAKKR